MGAGGLLSALSDSVSGNKESRMKQFLNPVHLPWADAQAGLQNCLPLPMKYLTLNLSEESKAVKSQESSHTPALEQKLPSLQLKLNRELGDRTRRRASGTV